MACEEIRNVCVYCASSQQAPEQYRDAAAVLGRTLAEQGRRIVFGAGAVGSMGALADGALAAGGEVVGVIPKFMVELEWAHQGLTELVVVEDMHVRKRKMLELSDALVALPGGSGTFEELLEAITWKRLGLFTGPIVILDQGGYYRPLIAQLDRSVSDRFMDERHREMWQVVADVEGVIPALDSAPPWSADSVRFAVRR